MLVNKSANCVFWANFTEEIHHETRMIAAPGKIFPYPHVLYDHYWEIFSFPKVDLRFRFIPIITLDFKLKGTKHDAAFVN